MDLRLPDSAAFLPAGIVAVFESGNNSWKQEFVRAASYHFL
jgi:hypothetical protein